MKFKILLCTLCLVKVNIAANIIQGPIVSDFMQSYFDLESEHWEGDTSSKSSESEENVAADNFGIPTLSLPQLQTISSGEDSLTNSIPPDSTSDAEDKHAIDPKNYPEIAQQFIEEERNHTNTVEAIYGFKPGEYEVISVDAVEGSVVVQIPAKNISNEVETVKQFLEEESKHTANIADGVPLIMQRVTFNAEPNEIVRSPDLTFCGAVNLNKIVDELLHGLRGDIVERGFDKIDIPDIHETFNKKMGVFKLKGNFNAQHGWAKNLSTIYRTADVLASTEGESLTLTCGFGLSHLEIGYDCYNAEFVNLGPHGKLNATVDSNSILINATVSWANKNCKVTLDGLVLDRLDGFRMKITGLGPFNALLGKISNWVFERFHTQIKEKVQSTLITEIDKLLLGFNCTKYMLSIPNL